MGFVPYFGNLGGKPIDVGNELNLVSVPLLLSFCPFSSCFQCLSCDFFLLFLLCGCVCVCGSPLHCLFFVLFMLFRSVCVCVCVHMCDLRPFCFHCLCFHFGTKSLPRFEQTPSTKHRQSIATGIVAAT
jgi:hypothetical protein